MNTKKYFTISIVASGLFLASCGEQKPAEEATMEAPASALQGDVTLKVDIAKSAVNWKGDMLKAYSHNGSINLTDGTVVLKGGRVVGGNFTIDMKSITPLDNGYDDKEHKKENLIGHLSSPDFFDVANFPTATFTITEGTGNAATGTLNLRGKTGNETIQNITLSEEAGAVKITGDITFNRKNYGAIFDMPTQDMVLSNDIVINVSLVAAR